MTLQPIKKFLPKNKMLEASKIVYDASSSIKKLGLDDVAEAHSFKNSVLVIKCKNSTAAWAVLRVKKEIIKALPPNSSIRTCLWSSNNSCL
ncbi:MAG: hypothetical protein ACD_76C00106G0037 [uncultured bacterium]|nr:MAG: hypothetical protein ACD_76C00106G0037 [uncultured bacterium]HBD05562.1 hypothetical protein [Candidatus Uhrbacteria bacterium]